MFRVGIYENNPPFTKFSNGVADGFEVSLSQEIANKIFENNGGKIEFIPTTADERIPFLQSNKVDAIISLYTITNKRKELVDFSMPYFSVNVAILSKKDKGLKNLFDLRSGEILARKNTTAESFLIQNNLKIKYCDDNVDCYRKLKNDEALAFAADNINVMTYALFDDEMEMSIKNLGKADFIGIGVIKGNEELLKLINENLLSLSKSGFFQRAYDETFEPFFKGMAERKHFLLDEVYKLF